MKKIVLSLAVLAVVGLGGYTLTKVALGNERLLGQMTPMGIPPFGGRTINSKPRNPCAEAIVAVDAAAQELSEYRQMDAYDAGRKGGNGPIPESDATKRAAAKLDEAKRRRDRACNTSPSTKTTLPSNSQPITGVTPPRR